MVDFGNATFDEGGDDWTAMGQPATAMPDLGAAQPTMMM